MKLCVIKGIINSEGNGKEASMAHFSVFSQHLASGAEANNENCSHDSISSGRVMLCCGIRFKNYSLIEKTI